MAAYLFDFEENLTQAVRNMKTAAKEASGVERDLNNATYLNTGFDRKFTSEVDKAVADLYRLKDAVLDLQRTGGGKRRAQLIPEGIIEGFKGGSLRDAGAYIDERLRLGTAADVGHRAARNNQALPRDLIGKIDNALSDTISSRIESFVKQASPLLGLREVGQQRRGDLSGDALHAAQAGFLDVAGQGRVLNKPNDEIIDAVRDYVSSIRESTREQDQATNQQRRQRGALADAHDEFIEAGKRALSLRGRLNQLQPAASGLHPLEAIQTLSKPAQALLADFTERYARQTPNKSGKSLERNAQPFRGFLRALGVDRRLVDEDYRFPLETSGSSLKDLLQGAHAEAERREPGTGRQARQEILDALHEEIRGTFERRVGDEYKDGTFRPQLTQDDAEAFEQRHEERLQLQRQIDEIENQARAKLNNAINEEARQRLASAEQVASNRAEEVNRAERAISRPGFEDVAAANRDSIRAAQVVDIDEARIGALTGDLRTPVTLQRPTAGDLPEDGGTPAADTSNKFADAADDIDHAARLFDDAAETLARLTGADGAGGGGKLPPGRGAGGLTPPGGGGGGGGGGHDDEPDDGLTPGERRRLRRAAIDRHPATRSQRQPGPFDLTNDEAINAIEDIERERERRNTARQQTRTSLTTPDGRFETGVFQADSGDIVDTRRELNGQIRIFTNNFDRINETTEDFEQRLRAAISGTPTETSERLRQLRQDSPDSVYDVNKNRSVVAELDPDGNIQSIYRQVSTGMQAVVGQTLQNMIDRLQPEVDAARERRANRGRLLDDNGVLRDRALEADGTEGGTLFPYAKNKVAEVINGNIERLYRFVNDDFEELAGYAKAQDLNPAENALKRLEEGQNPVGKPREAEGIFENFKAGFFQGGLFDHDDRTQGLSGQLEGLARSGGITAKYSLLGNLMYELQGAALQAIQEIGNFEDSVTELNIALNGLGQNDASVEFINRLADSASTAGVNVGDAMDAAGSAIRAFGEDMEKNGQATEESIRHLGSTFASEASKIAVITKTTYEDAQGNLRAIALAYDVPIASFSRVTDALAGAKQAAGGDEKQIGQGLANVGTTFSEVGFSLEETSVLLGKVIGQTDQSGQLVATRLSRVISIIGGSAGKSALIALNQTLSPDKKIDISGPIRNQVYQLSAIFEDLSERQKAVLVNALGGTTSSRELTIALENVKGLFDDVNSSAESGFLGKGSKEFRDRLEDIAATITQILGNLRNFLSAVANSGILDPFLALIKFGILPAISGLRTMAEQFNRLNDLANFEIFGHQEGIGRLIAQLVTILATVKLIQKFRGGGRGRGGEDADGTLDIDGGGDGGKDKKKKKKKKGGTDLPDIDADGDGGGGDGKDKGKGKGRRKRDKVKLSDLSVTDAVNKGAIGAATSVKDLYKALGNGSAVRNLGALTRGLAGFLGPIGLLAIGASFGTAAKDKSEEIQEQINALGRATAGTIEDYNKLADPATFRDAAANLDAASQALDDASKGFLGKITSKLSQDEIEGAQERAADVSEAYRRAANYIEKIKKDALNLGDTSALIDLSSPDAMAASIQAMQDAGYTVVDVGDAITEKFKEMAAAAQLGSTGLSEATRKIVGQDVGALVIKDLAGRQEAVAAGKGAATRVTIPSASVDDLINQTKTYGRRDSVNSAGDAALKSLKDQYAGIDTNKVQADVTKVTDDFLNDGRDILKALDFKYLVEEYEKILTGSGLDAQDTKEQATYAATQVRELIKKNRAEFVSNLPDFFRQVSAITDSYGQARATEVAFANRDNSGRVASSSYTAAKEAYDFLHGNLEVAREEIERGLKAPVSSQQYKDAKSLLPGLKQATLEDKQRFVAMQDASVENMRSQFSLLQASLPSESASQRLRDLGAEIDSELAKPGISPEKQTALAIEKAQNEIALRAQEVADALSIRRSRVDARDSLGAAREDVRAAQKAVDELRRKAEKDPSIYDSQAYGDAIIALGNANFQNLQARMEQAISFRNIDAFPESAVDTAIRATNDARDRLRLLYNKKRALGKQSKEYNDQRAEVARLERAETITLLEAASTAAKLTIDLSNPIQTAQNQLALARKKLAYLQSIGAPQDMIDSAQVDVTQNELDTQGTINSEWLDALQRAEQIGRISHNAYMQALRNKIDQVNAEIALMDPLSQGYDQAIKFRDQLLLLAKSAGESANQMFNIGDIKLPTPYEVRRAVKAGTFGGFMSANNPFSTEGNVVNDNSTRNLTLNGIPLQQVIAIVKDMFGVGAVATTNRRVP